MKGGGFFGSFSFGGRKILKHVLKIYNVKMYNWINLTRMRPVHGNEILFFHKMRVIYWVAQFFSISRGTLVLEVSFIKNVKMGLSLRRKIHGSRMSPKKKKPYNDSHTPNV
jgi:hypothetical protein